MFYRNLEVQSNEFKICNLKYLIVKLNIYLILSDLKIDFSQPTRCSL